MDTPVTGAPRLILRLEGFAVLVCCIVAYQASHGSWPLFAALLLVPDVSLAGYAINPKAGAGIYNTVHTYLGPAALAAAGALLGLSVIPVCIIWVAHIGMDRALGFGLKFPAAFRSTHLG